ncbi:MAG TPA: DUF2059 domain-containing protein [Alphaproteobacteria bacterium]|nr:DUF2059 domain-containing protein [Alphaproteobacteria bacterium]
MRLITLVVILALSCLPARAQEPGSSEALEAAKDLASIMSADLIGQMTSAMTAQIWPKLQAELGAKVDAATMTELRVEFEAAMKEFVVGAMTEAAPVYARHFSAQELRDMTAFYRSPTGARALQLMPKVMAEFFATIMPRTQSFDSDLKKRISAVLQRRGYIK